MTVQELIERLQEAPQKALVCFNNPNGGRLPIQGVRIEPRPSWDTGTNDKTTLVVLTD